jgi:hypothetical protein
LLADSIVCADSWTCTRQCAGVPSVYACIHYRLPQAKRGVMNCQIAIDAQCRTTKVQAKKIVRDWGNVALHTMPLEAIRAGTCAQWSAHNMPHWECQTLQWGTCTTYPVPVEEACEDVGAEQILFHVYEYKVLLHQDGKEHQS